MPLISRHDKNAIKVAATVIKASSCFEMLPCAIAQVHGIVLNILASVLLAGRLMARVYALPAQLLHPETDHKMHCFDVQRELLHIWRSTAVAVNNNVVLPAHSSMTHALARHGAVCKLPPAVFARCSKTCAHIALCNNE
jgi:hypothetical protein